MPDDRDMLTFDLGDDRYCVELARVTNVLDRGAIRSAEGPDYLAGRMEISGQTLRVIDVKRLFGITASVRHRGEIDDGEHVVAFDSRTGDDVDAWIVDEVRDTETVDVDDARTPARGAAHVEGVVDAGDEQVLWVDADEINQI